MTLADKTRRFRTIFVMAWRPMKHLISMAAALFLCACTSSSSPSVAPGSKDTGNPDSQSPAADVFTVKQVNDDVAVLQNGKPISFYKGFIIWTENKNYFWIRSKTYRFDSLKDSLV